MATAKKLPSGNWRVKVYSHKDENGKNVYMSFTASTKQQAEMKAAQFANKKIRDDSAGMTVARAIDGYIKAKDGVLSPSTIRSYIDLQRNYYKEIADVQIAKLTNEQVQLMISGLTGMRSPKTIKNIYALLTASIAFYSSDIKFNVTLPSTSKKTEKAPLNDDVRILFKMASQWMKICIALAAFGGLRRGEIASLKYKDVSDDTVLIHSDMVMDKDKKWIYKEIPKTKSSVRFVRLPKEVIALLGTGDPEEYIVKYNPNTISKMFIKLRDRMGVDVRFHDLRHYYASIGAVLNIPDVVLADFGGWRHDSPVMKNVYQGKITDIAEGYSKKMNDYFSDIINK